MTASPMPEAPGHVFMAEAVQLARRGIYTTHPNPNVGCVVVAGGEIVGRGWHRRAVIATAVLITG